MLNLQLDAAADDEIAALGIDRVGNDPRAFVEINQHNLIWVLQAGNLRVVHNHKAVDSAETAGHNGIPAQRVALATHRSRRMAQRCTVGAASGSVVRRVAILRTKRPCHAWETAGA